MRFKSGKTKLSAAHLQRLNFIATGLYVIQAILILIFSSPERAAKPITTGFLVQDKAGEAVGQPAGAQAYHALFDLNLAYLVAAMLLLAALFHLLAATRYRRDYEVGAKNKANKPRWVYSGLSLGLLMVITAMLSGMHEAAVLLIVFTLMEAVALSGYVIGKNAAENTTRRLPYLAGIKAGAVVGFVFLLYIAAAHVYGNGLPGFIYFVYLSLLLFFGALIINLYLQVKRMGHWENYLFSEKIFIIISFIGYSAVAWQIFAGTLR